MKKVFIVIVLSIVIGSFSNKVFSQEFMYASQEPTHLKETQEEDASVMVEIPKGGKLVVLGKDENWIKVMYDDKIGYVESSHVSSSASEEEAIPIDFLEIRNQYKENKDTMTKIKFKAWWDELEAGIKGKKVSSHGYVDSAKETWTGKLIVKLDVDPPSNTTSAYDIELKMNPEKDKEVVVELDKEEIVTFTGTVDIFSMTFGTLLVTVDDVTILSHEKE